MGHDAAGRLGSVNQGANGAVYRYLANSLLVRQIVFTNNGYTRMTTTKAHDYLDRLTSISSSPSSSSSILYAYSYNNASQRKVDENVVYGAGASALAAGRSQSCRRIG